ncbi:MAG: fibronectin type III domain-containing protein [Frankia sp.]|nr:fibronectin type III domain-containing protein [Frankia sp.]
MAFDTGQYRRTVLVPLSKDRARLEELQQVIRDLQGAGGSSAVARLDMAELFAVQPSMTAQELSAHLERLEMFFNKQKNLVPAQLLKRLLELLRKSGATVSDPRFWAGLAAARGQALKGRLADFARAIAQEYPLKVVTADLVAEQAASAGLRGIPPAELAAALEKHGVTVHPDFEIPKVTIPPPVRKVTEFPEFRTIVDVVLRPEQPSAVAVIEELSFGSPPRRIEPKDITAAQRRLQQQEARVEEKARQAAQNALAALTAYPSAAQLHALTLALLADTTQALLRRGMPRVTVRDELVRRGVRELDAARLVAKLAASTQVLGLNDVAERLAAGALGEARRLFDAIPAQDGEDPAERARIAASLAAAEKKKAGFLAQYESAVKRRDYVAATTALHAALAVDTQDDTLAERLAILPPLPPASMSARVDGRALDLAWSAPGEESVQYWVVRTAGAAPVNPTDGQVLAARLTATRYRDQRPPVATPLRYSVFATRDGMLFSEPASAAAIVLPAPAELSASAGATDVTLSWSTPPEAAQVVVTQTAADGSRLVHRPATPGQLTVTGLITGTRYRFSARCVYLLPGDRRGESEAVEVDATPRGAIRAVDDLRIEATEAGSRTTWSSVMGYSVELWALPVAARVTAGARVSFAALAAQRGRRLALRPLRAAGGVTAREFDPLPEVCLLVPVTVDGDGGLAGRPQIAGTVPTARTPTAERMGDELRISWEWPRGDYLMEVRWSVDGIPQVSLLSRADYNAAGGVRLTNADAVRDVSIATVVSAGTQKWLSPAVAVPVGGSAAARLRYSLAVRRSFRGRGSVTVTVECTQFRGTVQALTVLKEGKFPPISAADGTVVDRRSLDFSQHPLATFALDLGKVASPFWIRLFPGPDSGVRFEDPPTTQMRG